MPALKNFRSNLSSVLDLNGMSQYQLSDRAGVTRSYINRLLLGLVVPSIEYCERLSDTVNVPLPIMLLDPEKFRQAYSGSPGLDSAEILLPADSPKPPQPKRKKQRKSASEAAEEARLQLWAKRLLASS